MQKRSFMNTLNLRFQPYFGMNVWAFFISIYLSNPFFAAIESEKEPWYKSKLIPRYSLENYLPAIGDQGDIGSCTGWATTYYGMTIVKRIEGGINMPVFSPLSTYNRYSYLDKKSPDASGAWILPCLALLTRKGCPTVEDYPFPYGALDDGRTTYTHRLFDFNPLQPQNVNQIKEALLKNNPVVIGLSFVSNGRGYNLMSGYLDSNGVVLMDNFIAAKSMGGHAMCIVGYDDEVGGGAFKLVNSWGEAWGNKGFCWLRYRDLRIIHEAYALIPNSLSKPKIKNGFETEKIEITNTSNRIVYLSYGLNTKNGPKTKGWLMVKPSETLNLCIDERINNEVYFLAMNERGEVISNGKKSGKALPMCSNKAFETVGMKSEKEEMAIYKTYHLSNTRRTASFEILDFGRVSIVER